MRIVKLVKTVLAKMKKKMKKAKMKKEMKKAKMMMMTKGTLQYRKHATRGKNELKVPNLHLLRVRTGNVETSVVRKVHFVFRRRVVLRGRGIVGRVFSDEEPSLYLPESEYTFHGDP